MLTVCIIPSAITRFQGLAIMLYAVRSTYLGITSRVYGVMISELFRASWTDSDKTSPEMI